MEGVSFAASLHAATLDPHGATTLLLKPTKRKSRPSASSSNGSISAKAKDFLNRSKSFLSASSSSSSVGTRNSLSLPSPRSSEHGHRRKPDSVLLDGQSVFASSASSRFASAEYRRSSQTPPSFHKLSSPNQLQSPRPQKMTLQPNTDPNQTWISTLVDNDYISQEHFSPPSSPCSHYGKSDSDLEPSRASSMLDRDLVSLSSYEGSPQLPQPDLPPLLSASIAQQLACSFDADISSARALRPESSQHFVAIGPINTT
ncbi:hypothetical protein NDA18_001096 [Ustilago nuda]|nr:hypothetical protein NDA18_001096 [Ustilago nuda]